MWNPFRKSGASDHAEPSQSQTNRVQELVDALQRDGRVGELERELEAFDFSSLSPAEQETWRLLYGIVAFQAGRDADALQRFEEAYRQFPDSAQIRFSLGQQYIRARAIDQGFELFRSCRFPEVSGEYALAEARYAYLWDRYDDGLSYLRPLFEAYKQLKILDDHFLYVRGLPFFGRWWSHLAALSILSGELAELESVTNFVVQRCHDYDFDYLQAELQAYRADRPELMLATLERRLESNTAGGFPTGYLRMNIAVIHSRAAAAIEEARGVLDAVTLSGQDFRWLEDIRTLALAAAAHRLGDAEIEHEQIDRFRARQPLLFEPDIALNFHLLRYQERLKPRVAAP
jgi:hypothetical protein